MLGESLTIDCGAAGNPYPETHITSHDGQPLNGPSNSVLVFAYYLLRNGGIVASLQPRQSVRGSLSRENLSL